MYIDDVIKRQPFWGEWVIEKKIGEGSFGSVYMISRQDYTFVNKAAMKVICVPKDPKEHDRILENTGSIEGARQYCIGIRDRLLNEIKIMNQFKGNSQIVSMEDYKVEEASGDDFGFTLLIRMELCKTVNAFIDNKQDYFTNASELIRLGVSICNALETIHSNSLLHRDIKPGNIFVSQDGSFKLGDFGMAAGRYSGEEDPHAAGTYDYMAPEVCNNLGYDVRADLYSLGLTLYYFANGLRGPYLENVFSAPTRNDKNIAFTRRMKNEQMLPPALVPKPLADVILRACAFDQNERYMTARDFRIALVSVERELYSSNIGNSAWHSGSMSYSQSYIGGSFVTNDHSVGTPSFQGSISAGMSGTYSGSVSAGMNGSNMGSVPEGLSGSTRGSVPPKKKKGLIISLISIASFLVVSTAVVLAIVFSDSDRGDLPDVAITEESIKKDENPIDNAVDIIEDRVENTVNPETDGKSEPAPKSDPLLSDGSIVVYSDKGHIVKGMSKDDIKVEALFMDGTETVEGEFTLDCPEIITESGDYKWIFKPYSNEIYNDVEGQIQIKTFIPDMIEGMEAYNSVNDKSEILYLSLEGEGLTDVSFLAEAINLEKLNLDDNNLISLKGLENCKHLRTLAFNNNASLTDISSVLELKELNRVYTDSTGVDINDLLKLNERVKANKNASE